MATTAKISIPGEVGRARTPGRREDAPTSGVPQTFVAKTRARICRVRIPQPDRPRAVRRECPAQIAEGAMWPGVAAFSRFTPFQFRKAIPHTQKRCATRAGLAQSGGGNSEVTFGPAATLGCGFPQPGCGQTLLFQAFQCCVDAGEGPRASGLSIRFHGRWVLRMRPGQAGSGQGE